MRMIRRHVVAVLCGLAVLCCIGATESFAQGFSYKRKNQRPEEADRIRYRKSSDSYIITKRGQQQTVSRSEIEWVRAPQPADYTSIRTSLRSVSPSPDAIQKMERIVDDHEFLQWDREGNQELLRAYATLENWQKAEGKGKDLEQSGGVPAQVVQFYWQALRMNNKIALLRAQLSKAIEGGSRPMAAAALLVRGDLLRDEGNPREALLDGYFRVVILYKDVKNVQPEALYKTYEALKEQNDRRADRFRRKLLEEYPSSEYVGMVR